MEISGLATSCDELFRKICEISEIYIVKHYPKGPIIRREYDRFSLWAGNIAALQNAQLSNSLEYRLRHDPKARKLVVDNLQYLEESLRLALPIVSGQEPNETWDSRDEVDDSQSATYDNDAADKESFGAALQDSELHQLFAAVQGAVTQLFQLSMMIRKKTEKDDYTRAVYTLPMDPTNDIIYVKGKYPILVKERLWLAERLGYAITSRLQYLIYRESQREKLIKINGMGASEDGDSLCSGAFTSAYQNAELPKTIVGTQGETTYDIQWNTSLNSWLASLKHPPPHHQARTMAKTGYVDSKKRDERPGTLLRIPLPSKNPTGKRYKYDDSFECPYCRRPQTFKNKAEWTKHVLSDIRPYVCTFESCGHDTFRSQDEWFQHELENHRKQWTCILCMDQDLQTLESLGAHFSGLHADIHTEARIAIMDACLQPWISALGCPFCHTESERSQTINKSLKHDVALKQFQQHLGQHMEELALSAFPFDDDKSSNSGDDMDRTSSENDIYSSSFLVDQLELASTILESEIVEDAKTGDPESTMIYSKVAQLSSIYRRQNKWNISVHMLTGLVERATLRIGRSHPYRRQLLVELAYSLFLQGRSTDSEYLLWEYLDGRPEIEGRYADARLPDVRLAENLLLRIFLSQGRLGACGKLLDEIETRKRETGVRLHDRKPGPAKTHGKVTKVYHHFV